METEFKFTGIHDILVDISNFYLGTDNLEDLHNSLWQNSPEIVKTDLIKVSQYISKTSELYQQDTRSILRNIV